MNLYYKTKGKWYKMEHYQKEVQEVRKNINPDKYALIADDESDQGEFV